MYKITHERRAKSDKWIWNNHSISKWDSDNVKRPIKRSELNLTGSEEPAPVIINHSHAMPFSFSRCTSYLASAVSELYLRCIMEEGRRAVLLLCVYVAASAEGSENLVIWRIHTEIISPHSVQQEQSVICARQPKFSLLSLDCRIERDLQ